VRYWSKSHIWTYPTSTWHPSWGDPDWISPRSVASEN